MIRIFAMLAGVLSLAGCITPYPDLTQSRSPCRTEPGGWCDFVRETAVQTYPYAMLSANAYEDEDEYDVLPPGFKARGVAENDSSGLAYSVFDRFTIKPDGKLGDLAARIIAFRGTESGSAADIFSGSLGSGQRVGAQMVFEAERAVLDAEGKQSVKIEVTGHSLGGALATQISILNPDVKAFIFNSSPFFRGDPAKHDTFRVSVSERGEFLRLLRKYKAPPAADLLIINCSPSASAGKKHKIRNLADCLTWIAAYNDTTALGLLKPNGIKKPEVECGEDDMVHPEIASPPYPPCVHQARKKAE